MRVQGELEEGNLCYWIARMLGSNKTDEELCVALGLILIAAGQNNTELRGLKHTNILESKPAH
jgi:hypothetical protein